MIDRPNFNSAPAEESQEPEHESSEGMEGQMAVINRDVCPDCKPGDMLTFKVSKVHNDEIEVTYEGMGEEKGEDMPPAEEETETAPSGGGMY